MARAPFLFAPGYDCYNKIVKTSDLLILTFLGWCNNSYLKRIIEGQTLEIYGSEQDSCGNILFDQFERTSSKNIFILTQADKCTGVTVMYHALEFTNVNLMPITSYISTNSCGAQRKSVNPYNLMSIEFQYHNSR